jgi:Fe-S-cluster-containing dehydrogenase component/formate-dependent nitrite reductase membrane component NrfD
VKYAKIIDNRKCIGCHACSVACKEENQVPLGVFRTWVKYVEKGRFPNTRRYFQVTRCNQCENPPCVRICPTSAMYQRRNGIVEFNRENCIGCKACLQACPYDAIYIDPETHTAAKCHFCAHRIERGLEPSCVIVCPERAIIVGDMDDAGSQVAQLLARHQTFVRKPEQGTRPKLFYINGEHASLDPLAATRLDSWMWADTGETAYAPGNGSNSATRIVYDVPHEIPWGWKVSTYLWTKSIGAGAFFVPAFLLAFGAPISNLFATIAAFVALLFIGITTFFLVWDLKQPKRFLKVVLRPQKRSWLAWGAFILIAFSALGGVWFLAGAGQLIAPQDWLGQLQNLLTIPAAILAILSAIYSAFLFSQAEGRDLWQSPLLPLNLFLHATVAGSGALMIAAAFLAVPPLLTSIFIAGLVVLLATQLIADVAIPHATTNARHAHHELTRGRYAPLFWGGVIALVIALIASASFDAIAGVIALAGLLAVEHAWVQAGQIVPNS